MRMLLRSFLFCSLLLIFSTLASATIYRWVDANGKTHFSDTPPADSAAQEMTLPDRSPAIAAAVKTVAPAKKEVSSPPAAAVIPSPAAAPLVELYVTDWCGYCRKAEAWFTAKHIPFKAYNVEKDQKAAQRKAQLSRSRGVPLVVICNQQIPGYSPTDFEKALQNCR